MMLTGALRGAIGVAALHSVLGDPARGKHSSLFDHWLHLREAKAQVHMLPARTTATQDTQTGISTLPT
jgi:hypothetical protein